MRVTIWKIGDAKSINQAIDEAFSKSSSDLEALQSLASNNQVKLSLKGQERIHKVDTPNQEVTKEMFIELVNAVYKDKLITANDKERYLTTVGIEYSAKDILFYFKDYSLKDFEEKAPSVLKWFKKYHPQWVEKIQGEAGKSNALLSSSKLLSAMLKNKIISDKHFGTFKKLIGKEPEATQSILLSFIPDDFDMLHRHAPDTLQCLKEIDSARFNKLNEQYKEYLKLKR